MNATSDNAPYSPKETDKILDQAVLQIKQIQKQIDRLPSDKGPALDMLPDDFPPIRPFGTKAKTTLRLKEDIQTIKQDTIERLDKLLEKESPAEKQRMTLEIDKKLNSKQLPEMEINPIKEKQINSPEQEAPSAVSRFIQNLYYFNSNENSKFLPIKTQQKSHGKE